MNIIAEKAAQRIFITLPATLFCFVVTVSTLPPAWPETIRTFIVTYAVVWGAIMGVGLLLGIVALVLSPFADEAEQESWRNIKMAEF